MKWSTTPRNPTRADVKTHCPRGHRYTKKSTCFLKSGCKDCRICRLARVRADRPNNGRRGADGREKTHCPSGHAYSVENTRLDKSGCRHCRACSRSQAVAFYWRTKPARLAYHHQRRVERDPRLVAARERTYRKHRAKHLERGAKKISSLADAYVAHSLGMPVAALRANPMLLELKRTEMRTKRALKSHDKAFNLNGAA